jgi:hypothetical protein
MATDPRDKVFALIGVITDPDSIGLEPDYKLSTEEIYLLVETRNLEERKELELLAHGGVSSAPENSKFPQWVQDWSLSNDHKPIIATSTKGTKFCVRDSQSTLSISANKKMLIVRGVVIDIVL